MLFLWCFYKRHNFRQNLNDHSYFILLKLELFIFFKYLCFMRVFQDLRF